MSAAVTLGKELHKELVTGTNCVPCVLPKDSATKLTFKNKN